MHGPLCAAEISIDHFWLLLLVVKPRFVLAVLEKCDILEGGPASQIFECERLHKLFRVETQTSVIKNIFWNKCMRVLQLVKTLKCHLFFH